jgi:hypothetical protein
MQAGSLGIWYRSEDATTNAVNFLHRSGDRKIIVLKSQTLDNGLQGNY